MTTSNINLVVNADDLGLSSAFDAGIFHAHKEGIVTASSLFVNFPYLNNTLQDLKKYPDLDVGLHLNLTWGKSLSGGSSLGKDGKFLGKIKTLMINSWLGNLNYEEVYVEVKQQMSRFADSGLKCIHIDTHQHVLLIPEIARAVKELAPHFGFYRIRIPLEAYYPNIIKSTLLNSYSQLLNIKLGQRPTHNVYGILSAGELTTEYLKNVICKLKPGICELVCHPGYYKDEAFTEEKDFSELKYDRLKKLREIELQALCSDDVRSLLSEYKVRLTGWSELTDRSVKYTLRG